jgi:hypothetical protein
MNINKFTGKFTLILLLLVGSFFLFHCSQESVEEVHQPLTIIHGSVLSDGKEKSQKQGIPNASVVVTKIHDNGVVENITHEPTFTDEQGEFIIKTAARDAGNLVLVAKLNGKQWKAITKDKPEDNQKIIEITLTDETTIETEVFNRIKTIQNYHEVKISDIQKKITPEIARKVKGNVVAIAKLAELIYQEITDENLDNVTVISGKEISFTANQDKYSPCEKTNIIKNELKSHLQPHLRDDHDNLHNRINNDNLTIKSTFNTALLLCDDLAIQRLTNKTERRVLLQVEGDVPMSDQARQILENLMQMFGTYSENESISLEILKKNNTVHLYDSIDGNLSYYQKSIYERLIRQIKTDFKLLDKDNIRLEVKVNIYKSSRRTMESSSKA